MARAKNKKVTTKELPELAPEEIEKKFGRFLEEVKLTNDFMKHLATLSTGAILITSAFFENTTKPEAGFLVFLAMFAFVTSLTIIVLTQKTLVTHISETTDSLKKIPNAKNKIAFKFLINVAYFSFLIAIGFLLTFVFYIVFV